MADKVLSICSFSLLCPPCYHIAMQLQLNHTIGLVLLADDQKEVMHAQLFRSLSCFGSTVLVQCPRKRYYKCLISIFMCHLLPSSEVIHILAESFSWICQFQEDTVREAAKIFCILSCMIYLTEYPDRYFWLELLKPPIILQTSKDSHSITQ